MYALMAKAVLTNYDLSAVRLASGKPCCGARACVTHDSAICVFHPTARTAGVDENQRT